MRHGFLGRTGGVSRGEVEGLNVGLGSGDDPALIAENRRRAVASGAPGTALATVYQVHSAQCVVTTASWPDDQRPHADALVTDRPGMTLGILTADCAPVLFADREAGVIGAPDETTGQAIVAFVVLRGEEGPDEDLTADLRAHVTRELGPVARPQQVHVVSVLPKTRSGKIMRRLLLDLASGREPGDTTSIVDPSALDQAREVLTRS